MPAWPGIPPWLTMMRLIPINTIVARISWLSNIRIMFAKTLIVLACLNEKAGVLE
jgi:hypothetical protein